MSVSGHRRSPQHEEKQIREDCPEEVMTLSTRPKIWACVSLCAHGCSVKGGWNVQRGALRQSFGPPGKMARSVWRTGGQRGWNSDNGGTAEEGTGAKSRRPLYKRQQRRGKSSAYAPEPAGSVAIQDSDQSSIWAKGLRSRACPPALPWPRAAGSAGCRSPQDFHISFSNKVSRAARDSGVGRSPAPGDLLSNPEHDHFS